MIRLEISFWKKMLIFNLAGVSTATLLDARLVKKKTRVGNQFSVLELPFSPVPPFSFGKILPLPRRRATTWRMFVNGWYALKRYLSYSQYKPYSPRVVAIIMTRNCYILLRQKIVLSAELTFETQNTYKIKEMQNMLMHILYGVSRQ